MTPAGTDDDHGAPPAPDPAAAPTAPPGRRGAPARVAALIALGALVAASAGLFLALRRGPVDLAPLEADVKAARALLGKSGRSAAAEAAARDTTERLRWAKAWNEALASGAPADVRERAWEEMKRREAAAARSLPAARDEVRLLHGERW